MGWVVSKPVKVDLNKDREEYGRLENRFPSSSNSLENISNNLNPKYIDVVFETKEPLMQCDILVINHEVGCCESLNIINSSNTKEESLWSLPVDVMEQVEISTDNLENKVGNVVSTSSPVDIRICPKGDCKTSSKQLLKVEKKINSDLKIKKSMKDEIQQNVKNKSSVQKIDFIMRNKSRLRDNIFLESNFPSQFIKKKKCESIKSSKKMNSKRSISKNIQKLPSLCGSCEKSATKLMLRKAKDVKVETVKPPPSKTKVSNKTRTSVLNDVEHSKVNELYQVLFEDRNTSPLAVCEIEKKILPDCFMENNETLDETFHINPKRKFNFKQRPISALMPENKKENFENIIEDFNRKLEKIIKDNHLNNCLCNHCSSEESGLGNKSTAGRITFFFLKKYGNVGKFILARLNEFLDNVYKTLPDVKEKANTNDFPLPCNPNDIEYEGDLKSYTELVKDGILVQSKSWKSKLPKLIPNKNKACLREPSNNDESRHELSSKPEVSIKEHSQTSKKKSKGKGKKNVEIKIESVTKPFEVDLRLPPLKPASSIINFYKAPPAELSDNVVYKTMNLSTDRGILQTSTLNDILNIIYDENSTFDETILEQGQSQSDRIGTGTFSNGFDNCLTFEDRNEENISLMANKLIDDLWQSTFISESKSRSIKGD